MPNPLTTLHTLLGDAAFLRVKAAFSDVSAGVTQLTTEWAALPAQDTRNPADALVGATVKTTVRGFLTGWLPGKVNSDLTTHWDVNGDLFRPATIWETPPYGQDLTDPIDFSTPDWYWPLGLRIFLKAPRLWQDTRLPLVATDRTFNYGLEYYASEITTMAGYFASWPA